MSFLLLHDIVHRNRRHYLACLCGDCVPLRKKDRFYLNQRNVSSVLFVAHATVAKHVRLVPAAIHGQLRQEKFVGQLTNPSVDLAGQVVAVEDHLPDIGQLSQFRGHAALEGIVLQVQML